MHTLLLMWRVFVLVAGAVHIRMLFRLWQVRRSIDRAGERATGTSPAFGVISWICATVYIEVSVATHLLAGYEWRAPLATVTLFLGIRAARAMLDANWNLLREVGR